MTKRLTSERKKLQAHQPLGVEKKKKIKTVLVGNMEGERPPKEGVADTIIECKFSATNRVKRRHR